MNERLAIHISHVPKVPLNPIKISFVLNSECVFAFEKVKKVLSPSESPVFDLYIGTPEFFCTICQ